VSNQNLRRDEAAARSALITTRSYDVSLDVRQAADPDVAVLLLDVVLGYAAEADPAARLAPAIAAAIESAGTCGRDLSVVVSLCGTAGDPQNRERQAVDLVDAGAQVFSSNAAAARAACDLIESATEIGAS